MLKAVKSKINRAETVAASPRLSKTRGVCSGLRYANISYSDIHFDLDNSFAWCKCFCSRTRDHTRPIPDPTTQNISSALPTLSSCLFCKRCIFRGSRTNTRPHAAHAPAFLRADMIDNFQAQGFPHNLRACSLDHDHSCV